MDWKTKLVHADARVPQGFRSLVTPVYRGSTTLFESAADMVDDWNHDTSGYAYGLYGTPTTLELAARICALENGYRTFLAPGGQAALTLVYLAFASAGDHVLVPQSVYGPSREFAATVLRRCGVDVEFYPPLIGEDIGSLMRDRTRLVWCESPGSVTMEVQDVPAIAAAAHRAGATVALDTTYAAGVFFDAFAHGADVSVQALTKYVGGHSDLLLGSVTVRDDARYHKIGSVQRVLGQNVSPDDCSLALRGFQTLAVRLERIQANALAVAQWLAAREEVAAVLHPALASCPGHAVWKRDFTGSSGLFSVVFRGGVTRDAIVAFVDALELFEIGYSWGGVTSLAAPWRFAPERGVPYGDRLVRLYVGIEDADDLIADLDAAISAHIAR